VSVAAAALAAFSGPATADQTVFGSSLAGPANVVEDHSSDTAFWNTALTPAGSVQAPADGQITAIRVKGGLLDHDYSTVQGGADLASLIHFQVLHPQDASHYLIELSSGDFHLPITDDQQVVTEYKEPDLVNLCVHKGDFVDLNTIGGFEFRYDNYQGSPIHVFNLVRTSSIHWYQHGDGTNQGTVIDPNPPVGTVAPIEPRAADEQLELLMQTTLSTGPDATDICPGGYRQHIFRGLEYTVPAQPTVKTTEHVVRLKGDCYFENYGGCYGDISLDAVLDGQQRRLGTTAFAIQSATKGTIDIPISDADVLAIQNAKTVEGTVTATAHDDPRHDQRVKWDSVPVQQRTTSNTITLTPDKFPVVVAKPPCVVPKKLLGMTSSKAKSALKKANCAATVAYTTTKNPKQVGTVIATKPKKAGTVLPNASKVKLTVGKKKKKK
jgi:hypothetical protein